MALMHPKVKRVVHYLSYLILAVIFVAISAVTIVWANGWQYNNTTRSFQGTAIIAITDKLSDVQVLVNGKNVAQKTPYEQRGLTSGRYQVEIRKDGYNSYRRTFYLSAGEAGVIQDIQLIAQQPTVTKITDLTSFGTIEPFDAGLTFTSGELLDDGQLVSRFSSDILQAHRFQGNYLYQTGSQLRYIEAETGQDWLIYQVNSNALLQLKFPTFGWVISINDTPTPVTVDLITPTAAAASSQ